MLEIKLTAGEARVYREKFEFKRIVEQLNVDLNEHTNPDGEFEDDKFEELTEEAARELGLLFNVNRRVFFMTDWSIIEWYTSIIESYEYVQGAISIYRNLASPTDDLLATLHSIDTDRIPPMFQYLQGRLIGELEAYVELGQEMPEEKLAVSRKQMKLFYRKQ